MKTTFDEADYIIPHQVVTAFQKGKRTIKVISADTDVFVLLCYLIAHALSDCDTIPMFGLAKEKDSQNKLTIMILP